MVRYLWTCSLAFVVSLGAVGQKPVTDSTLYYNDLFSELESFLDSLTKPRTMFLMNVELGNNYLSYTNSSATALQADRKTTLSPSLGYFHKSGLGLTGSAAIISEAQKFNVYQFLLTGSYDYLKNYNWGTGFNFTRYFTKDSLTFYTSPLENEASWYITYKGGWLRPILGATYGWGSRTNVEERKKQINLMRIVPVGPGSTTVTEENISDFSVSASLKHDFYWLEKLGKKTALRFTPQVTFTSGTQNFGFNQTTNSYLLKNNKTNVLYNSENVQLDNSQSFQALSLSTFLKGELTYNRFFVQPQFIIDYYFPAKENNLTHGFRLNVGVSL